MDYTALLTLPNMKLKELLKHIVQELDTENLTKQRERYLKEYRDELENYSIHHPEFTEVPSALELYCDKNPGAPECLEYDV